MVKPLDGIVVLDLTRLLPGGVCTLMLADLGANVVKVEDPNGGDYTRWMPPAIDGQSVFFRVNNRNKRSLILDLKKPEGVTVLKRLAQHADVLVEGFRPGVMARLGCDYVVMKTVNPRLVYCSISGWGADGPYADRSGHDLNYVSIAGLVGGMETPQPLGAQLADVGGAYIAVAGILAALFRRERTGGGGFIDVSLFESALPFGMLPWVEALAAGTGGGQGGLTGGAACYHVYQARDGRAVSLAALEPKFWANFCAAVERPDLIPDYLLPERQPYLKAELTEIFALKTAEEWDTALKDADCCFTVVNPLSAVAHDPHVQARGMMGVDADGSPWIRSPIRLDGDTVERSSIPGYGQHTRDVLYEAGYSDGEIDMLIRDGVVKQG